MIIRPPREPKFVSWLLVILWSAFIFYTITQALDIRSKVDGNYGKQFVKYFVMGLAAAGAVWSVVIVIVNRSRYHWYNYVCLIGLLALYLYSVQYIYLSPEHSRWESMHFVQYGVLGVLLFRALAHSYQDFGVFPVALVLTVLHGAIDETVQWAHPDRYWDFGDLVLNGYSALLALLMIALGLNPAYLAKKMQPRTAVMLLGSLAAFLFYLGLCCSNTAKWTPFFEKNFPSIAEGAVKDGPMAEYGYLYEDPEIGVFKSRLSPEELKAADLARGKETAAMMPAARSRLLDSAAYSEFLKKYSPTSDPWLHELRVHLFSRDKNEQRTREQIEEPKPDYPEKVASMIHENLLIQKYYPTFFEAYPPRIDSRFIEEVAPKKAKGVYHSRVSRNLITEWSLTKIWVYLGVGMVACVAGIVALRKGTRNEA